MIKDILESPETIKKNNCKGLVFRGTVSSYFSAHKSVEVRKSLRLLKKDSCSGCEYCEWIWEYLSEDITSCFYHEDYMGVIKHGSKYKLKITTYKGYYDLYEEVGGVEFNEVVENANLLEEG